MGWVGLGGGEFGGGVSVSEEDGGRGEVLLGLHSRVKAAARQAWIN